MRKSVIAGGVLGTLLLFGVGLADWSNRGADDVTTDKDSEGDGLFSPANATVPSSAKGDTASSIGSAPTVTSASTPTLSATLMAPPKPLPDPGPVTLNVSVAKGDTLMKLLVRNDVARQQAHAVVTALKPVYDLRRMRIGQSFSLVMTPSSEALGEASQTSKAAAPKDVGQGLLSLSFRPSVDQDIIVRRTPKAGFKAEVVERPLERRDSHADGRITTSLYDSAIAADLPIDILMRLIQVFSFDVDFQREVQPGDAFEVLYDEYRDPLGDPVRTGAIVWASMTLSGKKLEYARYKPKGGFPDYYDRRGQSVKKTLMRTPINGARLSSRFGKRRHPVLGYTKIHRGVDFAAPKGVPIMAAGDGVIESLGRNGSYGKYIRIRHNSTYKTAYAHMSGYARGLKKGSRVRQGSTIGYVGTTGRSTGPHLHYEVLKNGRQTNPMSVRLPAGDKLKGKILKTFLAGWPGIDKRVAMAKGGEDVASD
jgi:murein DD-endopeptidase MepM/ murein hydrolase activator NlpD